MKPIQKTMVIFHKSHLPRIRDAIFGAEHLFDLHPLTDEQAEHQGFDRAEIFMMPVPESVLDKPGPLPNLEVDRIDTRYWDCAMSARNPWWYPAP